MQCRQQCSAIINFIAVGWCVWHNIVSIQCSDLQNSKLSLVHVSRAVELTVYIRALLLCDLHSLSRLTVSLALWIVRRFILLARPRLLAPLYSPQLSFKLSILSTNKLPMATAVSTPSAMQFHLLVLGIAICLSCFATPVVHSSYEETCQTYPVDPSVAVNTHNVLRSKVHPTSSNMRRIVRWYC